MKRINSCPGGIFTAVIARSLPAGGYFQYSELAGNDIAFVQIGRRLTGLDCLLEGLPVHRNRKLTATEPFTRL